MATKTDTLASAMASAFAEIEAATKQANNPHFKTKYADLGAVIEAIKPPLIKHGLFFTQHCHPSENGVSVETVLHHSGGERESLGTLYVPANKKDPQGFGSALTYARRYSLQTAFGVPTEDDDGNKAVATLKTDGPISEAQYATIITLLQTYSANTNNFLKKYGIANVGQLPAAKFDEAVEALNDYWQRKQEKLAQQDATLKQDLKRSLESVQ